MTKEEQAVIDAALKWPNRENEQLKRAVEALKASRITKEVLAEYESRLKANIKTTYLLGQIKLDLPREMYEQMYDDAEDEVRAELGMEAIRRD